MKSCISLTAITAAMALGLLGCSGTESPTGSDLATGPDELSTLGDRVSGEPLVVGFVARRGVQVGSVSVSNDDTHLSAEIVTEGGWEMHTTLFAVGLTLGELPFGGGGALRPGRVADRQMHNPPTTSCVHSFDWAERGYAIGDTLCVVVHGRVVLTDESGRSRLKTEAWGDGLPVPGPRLAMYFRYVIQEATLPDPCTIEVTRPNDAEFLCLGDFEEIAWLSSGDCAQSVTIDLYQDGVFCQTIAESVPNTGSFDWEVAESCDGNPFSYTVRVTDVVSGEFDESDEVFSIEDCGGGGEK